MKVLKRDGRKQEFSKDKIYDAVYQAACRVNEENADEIAEETADITEEIMANMDNIPVDAIHDAVERVLMQSNPNVAKEYIVYRSNRTNIRETKSALMDTIEELSAEMSKENANTDPSAATKMYQIASAANKKYVLSRLMNPKYAQMHIDGDWHIHDLDYYQHTINCMTHDLGKMLREGFDNGVGYIRPPKRIGSACALTAIILQSMQNNFFGGQAIDFLDRALAPYAEAEYKKQLSLINSLCGGWEDDKYMHDRAMVLTEKAVYQAMEALIYNLNTMKARSGNQVPFTSFNFGTDTSEFGRMVTRNLLKAFKAGLGNGESPLFPNLCYRIKKGINYDSTDVNYDLFQLALECASVRMHPTFSFMDSSFNAPFGEDAGYMGCRTRVLSNVNGKSGIAAKGNLFFTTLNLPRIAIYANSFHEFMQILDQITEDCIGQLLDRYDVCKKLKVKDLPFAMSGYYMGSEGLKSDDSIEPAIKNGTLSIGFIGLAETLTKICGSHHGESSEARRIGKIIIGYLRDRMDEATEDHKLNFSLIATPAEGLSGRFTKLDKKKFGVIPGVTDKEFYTNSFHVPVDYECTISHKIDVEAPYHVLTNAGHISYIELPMSPKDNIQGLERIIKYMAEKDMGYCGVNFGIDHCKQCHYLGTFEGDCPKCGSKDIKRVRRITGYMSEMDKFNDGKLAELKSRVVHGGRVSLG